MRRVAGARICVVALAACALACRPRAEAEPDQHHRLAAAVLSRHCAQCHAAGAAPPTLSTPDELARHADTIARTVERREMPPWGPDETGLCGSFTQRRWLEGSEVEAIRAWAAHASRASVAVVEPSSSSQDERATRTDGAFELAAAAPFLPALGDEATRCFVIDAPHDDVLAHAIRGDPRSRLVQTLWLVDPRSLPEHGRAPQGWACGDEGPPGAQLVFTWSWLTPRIALPPDAALQVKAGATLVLQARADLAAGGLGTAVQPSLTLERGGSRGATQIAIDVAPEPGPSTSRRSQASATWRAPARMSIVGLVPRLGARARALEVAVTHADQRACVGYFGHWRPRVEQLYVRDHAVVVDEGDVVTLTCTLREADTAPPAANEDRADTDDAELRRCGAVLWVTEGG